MDVRTCRNCKKIFNYLSGPIICPSCKDEMEQKFQEVKAYISEHKGANMTEVAEACDVDVSQIRQWLKDDRLELTEDSAIFLTCEHCGASIRSGRYCDACRNSMANGFQNIIDKGKPKAPEKPIKKDKDNPKMRFLS